MAGRKVGVLLLAALALTAAAWTFGFSIQSSPGCLSIGNASYRVATKILGADLTVRIDTAAAAPDIRIAFAETPDEADFVFVDDGNSPPACGASAKSVRIDAAAMQLNLVVGLAREQGPADYRIYVRSRWLSSEAAAALFAAAHAPLRLAGHMANR